MTTEAILAELQKRYGNDKVTVTLSKDKNGEDTIAFVPSSRKEEEYALLKAITLAWICLGKELYRAK